ncbi:MAG: ELM1/GtrOC1 family putative glycosyltransferase [Pseudomonadales bacterium]
MALLTQRALKGLLPRLDADRTPTGQPYPEKIVLGVKPGHPLSDRPPVRIFLGSERNQFRAERVFIWSVEQCRDPGRVYEIFLLKGLPGYGGRFWLTGFTNYRFAIPHYCDYQGRAIYNDVDQVYLRDPAELFDQPMGEAGFLAISDRDTSVMLMDCAKLRAVWAAPAIFRDTRKQHEARARAQGLWGPLHGRWNARDAEYQPRDSGLVHFTTLHTQPWRPLPNSFVYFANPTGRLWPDLEREADGAAFLPVSATRPSAAWPGALQALARRPDGAELTTLLGIAPPAERAPQRTVRAWLEQVPDPDLPWVLARLFESSDSLDVSIDEPLLIGPSRPRRSRWFWLQQFQLASRLHPQVRWRLQRRVGWRRQQFHGGPAPDGAIRVLCHRKPGHTNQARTLAAALAAATGRRLELHTIAGGDAGYLLRRLLRRPLPAALQPPLLAEAPVLVASGWLPCQYARWIARCQGSRPQLVLMGRKAGRPPDHGGLVINCRHFNLPPHPNQLQTLLPLNSPPPAPAPAAASRWHAWLDAPRRVAVLVGGASRSHRFGDAEARALGQAAVAWAQANQAALLVVTSRRTAARLEALAQAIGTAGLVYAWQPDDAANPYSLALTHADALMVTGESESMLADAVHSGRPALIWSLPEKHGGWQRLAQAVTARASRPRINRRGSIRPQQGLTYLCALLLAWRWVLPSRDLAQLQQQLVSSGAASLPGHAPTADAHAPPGSLAPEVQAVAAEVARRLQLSLTAGAHAAAAPGEQAEQRQSGGSSG